MGRPTKCTPEVQDRIVQAVSAGATYEHAAMYGGVDERTFYRWMAAGEKGRQPYSQFRQAIKDAEGAGVVANLAHIRKAAADGTWQAAAWLLERRYPAIYGRRVVESTADVTMVPFDWDAAIGTVAKRPTEHTEPSGNGESPKRG